MQGYIKYWHLNWLLSCIFCLIFFLNEYVLAWGAVSCIIVDTCVSNSTLLHLYHLHLHFAREKTLVPLGQMAGRLMCIFWNINPLMCIFLNITPLRCSALYHCWQLYTCTTWSDVAKAYRAQNAGTQMALYETSIKSLVRKKVFLDKNYVIRGCKAQLEILCKCALWPHICSSCISGGLQRKWPFFMTFAIRRSFTFCWKKGFNLPFSFDCQL